MDQSKLKPNAKAEWSREGTLTVTAAMELAILWYCSELYPGLHLVGQRLNR